MMSALKEYGVLLPPNGHDEADGLVFTIVEVRGGCN